MSRASVLRQARDEAVVNRGAPPYPGDASSALAAAAAASCSCSQAREDSVDCRPSHQAQQMPSGRLCEVLVVVVDDDDDVVAVVDDDVVVVVVDYDIAAHIPVRKQMFSRSSWSMVLLTRTAMMRHGLQRAAGGYFGLRRH